MLTAIGVRLLPWLDEEVLTRADSVLGEASGLLWEFQLYIRRWRLALDV